MRRLHQILVALVLILGLGAGLAAPAAAQPVPAATSTDRRTVMIVGNNWEGTASIVDATTHRVIKKINIVPDLQAELSAIYTDPARLAFYVAVQQGVGEGHDQYVDDMFFTADGRYVAVSRPSLSDVVWIDVHKAMQGRTDTIVAEQQMDGFRTDHMQVSRGRNRLLVSDSTERQVIEFAMSTYTLPSGRVLHMGDRLRTFGTGDTPHESNYTVDGKRIFHASIGRVYTPGDYGYVGPVDASTISDAVKADRWLQEVDNASFQVTRRWDMGKELAEAGYPGMSSAVRPMTLTKDAKTAYLQVSFFHGIVEFGIDDVDPTGGGDYATGGLPEPRTGKVRRIIPLPNYVPDLPREQYVLDSAHHGLAINATDTKLCAAGTMSDYAAIVRVGTLHKTIIRGASPYLKGRNYAKPYWATEGPGNTCWMSMSGSDMVTIIDFATEKVIADVPVGDHPQRVRVGRIPSSWT